MDHGGFAVTRSQFATNLANKLNDKQFAADIGPLLAPGYTWDLNVMSDNVQHHLISLVRD